MTKKLVVVLGMHRSGTSAITRGLKTLGVDLGEEFIPHQADNVKGFWEDREFKELNERMLKSLGHDWHTLKLIDRHTVSDRLASFRVNALDLLRTKVSSAETFGVKDPRFSLLMPFWQQLFESENIQPLYIVSLRNPISVALSLQKRNGFNFEKSFFLWQQYMIQSAFAVLEAPHVVIDFDQVLSQPGAELERASGMLGLQKPDEHELKEYVNSFLDKGLRHARYSFDDLRQESALPEGVLKLFELFHEVATDQRQLSESVVESLLEKEWEHLRGFSPALDYSDLLEGRLESAEVSIQKLEQLLVDRKADIHKQTQALQEHRLVIERHKTTLEEQKTLIETQKASMAEQKASMAEQKASMEEGYLSVISDHQARYATKRKLIELRCREIDRLNSELKNKSQALRGKDSENAELNRQLVEQATEFKKVSSQYENIVASTDFSLVQKLRVVSDCKRNVVAVAGDILGEKGNSGTFKKGQKLIQSSVLFDEVFYLNGFSKSNSPEDPMVHYMVRGWREGRNPSALFDSNWYLEAYPDVAAASVCPLVHYLESGWREHRQANPLFDTVWYLQRYEDVRIADVEPLQHYIQFGCAEKRQPNRFFDAIWYENKYNKDLSISGLSHLEHYLSQRDSQEQYFEHDSIFVSPDYFAKNGLLGSKVELALEHFLSRVEPYLNADAERAFIDEGARSSFDFKAERDFRRRIKRASGIGVLNTAKVSIVMPTHNRKDKIFDAIDSVLAQSYENWELLIVDDGSDDGTYECVTDAYDDNRIKIQRTLGFGVCHARNAALKAADGALVAYLDSDNTWERGFLEVMVACQQLEAADFVYCAIRMFSEQRTTYRYREFGYQDLLIKNYIDLNAIVHKRFLYDELGGFDESLSRMVDWDLVIRYTKDVVVQPIPFLGVNYDNTRQTDRITVSQPKSWRYAIMNKHLIDWSAQLSEVENRDSELVSIVIPVYGQLELTKKCIFSLLNIPAGRKFEIIAVDNGSGHDVLEQLFMWSEGRTEITLVRNTENLNFALGCNLGFAKSRGKYVVFLNNDTEVTSGWLDTLLKPLVSSDIGAVQPKLLYPDGQIQCSGIVFSQRSPVGFPIYSDYSSNLPQTQISRKYQAVTAACMAVDSKDFAQLKGFDPLYVNGQEDVDFCLRLAGLGKSCWYEAGSLVIHHESRTPGRGQYVAQNRELFAKRWAEKIIPDAEGLLRDDGFAIQGWRGDGQGVEGYQPLLRRRADGEEGMPSKLFAIKVPCPHAGIKEEWGDYHFARSLGAALVRAGHAFRIDFLNEWVPQGNDGEVNLVLRGLSEFEPKKGQVNLMWMISHPDKINLSEMEKYDHVFVASEQYVHSLRGDLGNKVSCLLQCTDPALFYPDENQPAFATDVLFVGNSRNQYREVVQAAVKQELGLSVFGTRWEQFLPACYIKGQNIPNQQLAAHYRNARVVLNDHWPDMRAKGFISNRIFDVLACGTPIVSDRISGLPKEFEDLVLQYDDVGRDLRHSVESAQNEDLLRKQERFRIALKVHELHSFDARVESLLQILNNRITA